MRIRSHVVAALLSAAGSASAQCDFWIPYVPDFDQRRMAVGGTPGLPADGGMYCVPTSAVNFFAYFANRGISQPLTLAGPHNWQSNANYNRVTSVVSTMGSLMSTHPLNGTGGSGHYYGALAYALAYAQNKVTVKLYWCGSGSICPSPQGIVLIRSLGGFVSPCYGYYVESPANFFTRSGGHCISVVGEVNVCSGTPYLQFRDPADDPANATQSTFTTRAATMTGIAGNFRGKVGQSYTAQTRWRLNYGNSLKFLDSWLVLDPVIALTYSSSDTGQLQVLRPYRLDDSSLPAVQSFATPAGTGPIAELVMHPQGLDYYYITSSPPGGATIYRLFHLNPATGVSTPVLTSTGILKHLVFGRMGDAYTCDGSVLKRFSADGSVFQLLGSRTLTTVPEALACDDAGDVIATLTPSAVTAAHILTRYSRNMDTILGSAALPGLPAISGEVAMDFRRADGHLFMCASGNPFIFQFNNLGTAAFPSIPLPGGSSPRGLNMADGGNALFVNNGVLNEYMEVAGAGWMLDPSSLFSGQPAGNRVFLSRSRTNHDPALHEGPEFNNIPNPEIAPIGTLDCYANCDGSTLAPVLNVNDFSCYVNLFAAGRFEANCDDSTIAPILNVNDFSCFLNKYAQGCP